MAKIVVVGSTNLDMVVKAPHIPRPGETVLGGRFTMVPGGKGANQAVAAARLGAEVALVARIGNDAFGEAAAAQFRAEGIDTRFLVRDPNEAHGIALILVDHQGENAIAVAPGANACLTPEDVDRAEPAIAACDALLLQLEVPMAAVERAAELAAKHGRRIILNPAPAAPVSDVLLERVDVLALNETEAEMLLDRTDAGLGGIAATARALLGRGAGRVIVTLGKEGVFVVGPGEEEYHVPGRRVKAVDTTAAGDAFCGALAVWTSEGTPFREAVRSAVAASAISVTRLGAQASLPTRAEVEAMLGGSSS